MTVCPIAVILGTSFGSPGKTPREFRDWLWCNCAWWRGWTRLVAAVKANLEKLASGDLVQVVEVVRDLRGGDEAAEAAHAAPGEPAPAERNRVRVVTEHRDQAPDGEDADPGVLDRDQDPLGPRCQLDSEVGDGGDQHHRDEPDDR